jgi:lipoprotein-anchoring transpeptidase ErfK/SrfK
MSLVRPALVALALTLLMAPAAAAQEPAPTPPPPPQEQRIPPNVSAGGVDLSNLTLPEAEAKLHQSLDAVLATPITVAVAGKRWTLEPAKVGFAFDALATAQRAYEAGATRADAGPTLVAIVVTYRRTPIKRFAGRINKGVLLRPQNAKLKIGLRKMHITKARTGRDLDQKALRATIESVLGDPAAGRLLKPGRKTTQAKIRQHDLRRIHSTVITIDKANFRLRLFKRLRFKKSYAIAVGLPAYPTPSGLFRITNKAVNPVWTAPNAPWAGELAGQSVAGGAANNPLRARWMGIVNGVGIHGTGQEWSIGTRASHGCIRMRVADVIDLYPRVPVGSRVLIR